MKRFALASLLLVASSIGTGCHSCQSPYDYSSPVAGSQCGSCGSGRAGSTLSGGCTTCSQEPLETVPQYEESYLDQGTMMESVVE